MSNATAPPPSTPLWTKDQLLGAVERGFLAALGAFTGALVVTNTTPQGLEHSAIAAGIGAGVAFLSKMGSYLNS